MYRSVALNAIRGSASKRAAPKVANAGPHHAPAFQRSLVSTVLLTRDAYDSKRVVELRGELKNRGLSTNGKRQDLIARLLDSDRQRSKVLPVGDAEQSRKASTRATPAATKHEDSVLPSTSEGAVGGMEKATVSHPPDMEPGTVSSNDVDGLLIQKAVLEAPPTAPGVPPEKTAQVPVTFEVKIPYEEPVRESGPEIPLMTSYFHPESPMYHPSPSDREGPVAHVPKIATVSGEETYPGGGPSHHLADFDASELSSETRQGDKGSVSDEQTLSSAISSMFKSMRDDLGMAVDPALEKQAKEASATTFESTRKVLKDARDNLASRLGSSGSGSGSGSASYSTSSYSGGPARPMNDEETRGLYILGGIIGVGFWLGGLGKPSKQSVEKVKAEVAEKAQEAKRETPIVPDAELTQLVSKAEVALRGA